MTSRIDAALGRAALAALLVAGTLLSGCAAVIVGGVVGGALIATDRRTTGAQVDDEVIELKSNGRMTDTFGEKARINTTSYNRMVLLTGEVATAQDKSSAEQVVARIENVKSVVNELTVGPTNTFGEKSRDAFTTTKVKASLVDAKDLFANSIKVVTHRGVVYLMGRVTDREATRASEIARGVSGVSKVVRVFEIVSEPELANKAPRTLATPDSPPAQQPPAAEATPIR